ncbi:AraC family transcriptional regulator [Sphingosinicella sp. LHD-64]|uniref:AraC family transcriptional regulator n=1 Tax=Sphingosinicella sp. LHD-64 TaxID=3072139 RepID=UPI00280C42F5|nr:AraC family transcriptional regulator [Sphingosinicella sp. LHD-64]MDQ8757550.1 AraC family transcriptional regulator [Sphingosinicella sp. LHD-64]
MTTTEAFVHVVASLQGTIVAGSEGGGREIGAGSAILLARPGRSECLCSAEASALLLRIPRPAIQAVASRRLGAPRRLAFIDRGFVWLPMTGPDGRPVVDPAGFARAAMRGDGRCKELETIESLVEAVCTGQDRDLVFPIAGSVHRAATHMHAHPQRVWNVDDLVPIAGVTAATLRRNFRACLGTTVAGLSREIRLDWFNAQLRSPTESRSIGRLAAVAGFDPSGRLTRLYQERFGETPSRTRARAFNG